MNFKNIEELVDGSGTITIGAITSINCAATASDSDQCLAMLVRKKDETLLELLQRLDIAIEEAYENQKFIDEVNAKI